MSDAPTTKKSKTSTEKSTPSETASGSVTESTSADSSSAAKSSAPARTTSYFSSVSTDEYRNGWADIFGDKNKKKTNRKSTRRAAAPSLPVTIELSGDDLDDDTKALLIAAVRKKARKDKIPLGRALSKGTLTWSIDCEIGE